METWTKTSGPIPGGLILSHTQAVPCHDFYALGASGLLVTAGHSQATQLPEPSGANLRTIGVCPGVDAGSILFKNQGAFLGLKLNQAKRIDKSIYRVDSLSILFNHCSFLKTPSYFAFFFFFFLMVF